MKPNRLIAMLLIVAATVSAADLTIRFEKTAAQFTEAPPLGNSRLGAMVFGTPD